MKKPTTPLDIACCLLAASALLTAILCCDMSPAWSPDGKRVAFSVIMHEDKDHPKVGVAIHEVGSGETRLVYEGDGYGMIRLAYAPDGEHLYGLALREHAVDCLRIGPDGAEVVREGVERDKKGEGTWLGPVFVHAGRLWSWETNDDRARPEGEIEPEEWFGCQWIDIASGEVSYPFGERSLLPARGRAGLFYVEDVPGVAGDDDDLVAFGKLVEEDGGYEAVELWRRPIKFGSLGILVVGEENVAMVVEVKGDVQADGRTGFHLHILDTDGETRRDILLPGSSTYGVMAFTAADRAVWLAHDEGKALVRVSIADGVVAEYETASLYDGDPGEVFGMAPSPTSSTIALAVFASDDDKSADVPPLLLMDDVGDGEEPRVTAVTLPR